MQDTVVSSLIIAVISAMAFVAYNHPKSWRQINTWIWLLCTFVLVAAMSWILALSKAKTALIPLIKDYEKLNKALSHIELDSNLTLIIWVFFCIYMFVLDYVVSKLKEPEE